MKRTIKELTIVMRTIQYLIFKMKVERSIRGAFTSTFSRKGSTYRLGDGPYVNGSSYDMIREMILRRER